MIGPISLTNYSEFSGKAKSFAAQFNPCVILDSCEISPILSNGKYKLLLAFGGNVVIEPNTNLLNTLYNFWNDNKNWIFGVLGFNIKNEIEKLDSLNSKCFNWPDLSFFVPLNVLTISWDNELIIYGGSSNSIYDQINAIVLNKQFFKPKIRDLKLISDFTQQSHAFVVNKIKEEIRSGNVYELNLCSRFLMEEADIDNCYELYNKLIEISPAPFSGFLSLNNKKVLSASPERYLCKLNQNIVSQPIKGTRGRGTDLLSDAALKNDLQTNKKDIAENVMIVDLVRNDLARVSKPGSIKVDELFGVYSYSHVHQMVSSISSEMEDKYNWNDLLKASFPMGSMTGAPKIAALKFIEYFENSNREWYSGALGYIDPEGNLDFNVLIRSIFYDSDSKNLAYYAGGAITIDSDTNDEYEEMLVKAKAIEQLLKSYL